MTTAAKIEANQRNAELSTGPNTPEGKQNSSQNRRTHGLASATILGESVHPEFAGRLAAWSADYPVESLEARFALETAVAMTFRISECYTAERATVEREMQRARLSWDEDRFAEVADLLAALPRKPEVVAYKLKASAQGLTAMIRLWDQLRETLDAKRGAWSEKETSTACDLLGIAPHLRDGRLPFDPPEPGDPHASRRDFIAREVAALRSSLDNRLRPADSLSREMTAKGTTAFLNKSVQLIYRYEREAWRRYKEAMKVFEAESAALLMARQDAARRVAERSAPPRPRPAAPPPPMRPSPAEAPAAVVSPGDARIIAPAAPVLTPVMSPASAPRPMNRHQRRREKALARA